MDRAELIGIITKRLGSEVESIAETANDDLTLVLHKDKLVSSIGILKNDPALGFSTLMNQLGVDYGDRMASIYNLFSPILKRKITVKVYLDREKPELASLERAYHGINWYERETYDMFGIRFIGNSNLKRLLLPDDWEGHPLRKDYVYPQTYNGMETGRKELPERPLTGEALV